MSTALVEEIEENFESNELYRAKYANKKDDLIEGAHRNPFVYLPPTLQAFGPDATSIEIIGRLMWHTSSNKENIEASYRLYRKAEAAFPDVPFIKLLRATCLTYLSSEPSAFVDQLEGVKKMNPDFLVRFLLYKRDVESKQQSSLAKKEGDQSLDLVAYVEFQKYYQ